jgi:isochorismate pyruvate lyase
MTKNIADMEPNSPARAARQPAECATMAEVRQQIDRIDRELVALLATRQHYVESAARIKQDRSLVRDDTRIREVLDNVIAQAGNEGLDPHLAKAVWNALIEASIAHEYTVFDRKHDDH